MPQSADEIERGLLHALQLDGRVSFALVAEVLGVSERTVERRYRELRSRGVRVVGRTRPEAAGERQWLVRVGCVPDAAEGLAHAVARLPETSWVQLTSGGAELLSMVRVPVEDGPPSSSSVLSRLPRSPRVTRVDGLSILRVFAGGRISPLTKIGPLPDAAVARIVREEEVVPATVRLLPDDGPLLAVLAQDGRARWRDLADAAGRSAATARRRVTELHRGGAIFFDVDVPPSLLGLRSQAALWISVHPAALVAAGETLAAHPEVGFAAATTGATNLYASVQLRDDHALFDYLTGPVTALPGLVSIQTAPVLRTIKQT